jgi:RNA polymerase sigma-70 factor (ECF subfamily)
MAPPTTTRDRPEAELNARGARETDAGDVGRSGLSEQFVAWITGAQRPLYAYIRTLVGPGADASDILQAVNLVLCRKASEFDGRGQFLTWACRVAYLQVLAHLKARRRDRHAYFDEAVLEDLAGPLSAQVEQLDARVEALRHCLAGLSSTHRQMITARYAPGGSVEQVGRPAGSVRVTLHRIRLLLLECIRRTLDAEGRA